MKDMTRQVRGCMQVLGYGFLFAAGHAFFALPTIGMTHVGRLMPLLRPRKATSTTRRMRRTRVPRILPPRLVWRDSVGDRRQTSLPGMKRCLARVCPSGDTNYECRRMRKTSGLRTASTRRRVTSSRSRSRQVQGHLISLLWHDMVDMVPARSRNLFLAMNSSGDTLCKFINDRSLSGPWVRDPTRA
jgi:hypothetical protein